jgi:hypothetical protein
MFFATAKWYDLVLNNEMLFCPMCGVRYTHAENKGIYSLKIKP